MAEQFFGWSETSKRTIHGGDSPPSALFRTYCATKPVLAMEFIAKYGLVGLDAQPKSLRPDRRLTGVRVTVRDLLEHRVSGNSFGIADYLLTRREDRDRLLWQHIERDYGIAVRQRAAFSEIQAWTLLRVIVSRTEPEIVAQWFAPWAH